MLEPPPSQPTGIENSPEFLDGGLARGAWQFATTAHAGQRRKGDGAPYILHPEAVAELVADHGGDEIQIAAALLHDVLEDTETPAVAISERFGAAVGALVVALSDDPGIEAYELRKRALRVQVEAAGERAQLIYAADKLANSRELLRVYRNDGEAVGDRYKAPLDVRIRIWRDDLRMLRDRLGPTELVEDLRLQLDAVESERASPSA